jgi:UDP-glucose 4-epimerase
MSGIIIKLLKGERPVIYGNGSKRRDFVYIDDVNDFHVLAMNDDRTNGQTYNLGGGRNYSIMEVYRAIKDLLKSDLEPIFKDDVEGEAQENLGDISKAKTLGWQPKVELEEGLKHSIDFIKEHVIGRM